MICLTCGWEIVIGPAGCACTQKARREREMAEAAKVGEQLAQSIKKVDWGNCDRCGKPSSCCRYSIDLNFNDKPPELCQACYDEWERLSASFLDHFMKKPPSSTVKGSCTYVRPATHGGKTLICRLEEGHSGLHHAVYAGNDVYFETHTCEHTPPCGRGF